MIPIFLIPIAYTGLKGLTVWYIDNSVAANLNEGVLKGTILAKSETLRKIRSILISSLIVLAINIFILLFVIFVPIFSSSTQIFAICTVYMSSVLHTAFKSIRKWRVYKEIIVNYKLNIFKYIFDKIRGEVSIEVETRARKELQERLDKEFSEMGYLKSSWVYLFGKSKEQIHKETCPKVYEPIIENTMKEIVPVVITKVIIYIIIFFTYILLFRLIVAPELLKDSTNLNTIQAFFYPFLHSIDYFTGINLARLLN